MFSESQQKEWRISYYNPPAHKITTFTEHSRHGTEEPFSPESLLPKLKIFEVQIRDDEAVELATATLNKHYKNEQAQRTILVLQNLSEEAAWNITFITNTFKVINIRLSAESGKEISHTMSNVTDFMQNPQDVNLRK